MSPELILKESSYIRKISKSRPVVLFHAKGSYSYPVDGEIGWKQIEQEEFSHSHGFYSVESYDPYGIRIGKPSLESGKSAYLSLLTAMKAIQKRRGDLITLPLSKEWVMRSGFPKFTGHTEELGKFFGNQTFMLMHGRFLNVIPLTTHVPLKRVIPSLKKIDWEALFQAIRNSRLFPNKPSIAYLGVNPHAGEGGKLGREEEDIFAKPMSEWVKKAKIIGPLSADSAFLGLSLSRRPSWNICLAAYHDQGLIPFKLLEGKDGINVTLGLPFRRVSPDHGTAFGIAGQGIVDSKSFKRCLEFFVT